MSDDGKNKLTFYIMLVVIMVIGVVLFVVPAKAEQARALFCDTPDQVEVVYTLHAEGVAAEDVVKAVNKQAGSQACGVALVEADVVDVVKTLVIKGDTYTIIKVIIRAVSVGGMMRPVMDIEQYALMTGKKSTGI